MTSPGKTLVISNESFLGKVLNLFFFRKFTYLWKKGLKIPFWLLQKLQVVYENYCAPFLAQKASWLLWPAYSYFKHRNYCFIANIAEGVGHILCELDYFARLQYLKKIDPCKKYVWIRKKQEFSDTCIGRYSFLFHRAFSSNLLYNLSLPLIMAFPDITLDCGLSRLKWQLPVDKRKLQNKKGYLYQIAKQENLEKWCEYYKLKNSSASFFPLKTPNKSKPIKELLQIQQTLIALIQLKQTIKNALALPTDPLTYVPTISYLQSLGYVVVFTGREPMPAIFNKLNVINYAESPYASFDNDLDLFSLADLVICSGSGLSFLAECQNKPYLYINSWQLASPIHSPLAIVIPTLVETKKDKQLLSFNEQIALYLSLEDQGNEVFPSTHYIARNASAEEILEGTKELLELFHGLHEENDLQILFRKNCTAGPLKHSKAHLSRYFLKIHKELLDHE